MAILAGMALCRSDIADAAVTMVVKQTACRVCPDGKLKRSNAGAAAEIAAYTWYGRGREVRVFRNL